MRICDLVGRVPQPGGAKSKGDHVPRPDEVYIQSVLPEINEQLMFACRFPDLSATGNEVGTVLYHFSELDEKTRQKVAEVLHNNVGRTLLSIGIIEIPED